MRRVLLAVATLLGVVVGVGVLWRQVSVRRRLPCPWWLGWLFGNRWSEALTGVRRLLDRAGIAPGMAVLDAGSGPGRLTLPAARRVGAAGQVLALDLQRPMLDRLCRRARAAGLTNIEVIVGGIGQGLLPRNTFDRALMALVLGEIPARERTAAMREIWAALKPGGILAVTEILPDPHHQRPEAVRRLAESVGFRVQRRFGSFLAYTMNLEKPKGEGEPGGSG